MYNYVLKSSMTVQPQKHFTLTKTGLMIGENFLLDEWADHCARDKVYEAFICTGPIPFSRAVGAPVNPIASL